MVPAAARWQETLRGRSVAFRDSQFAVDHDRSWGLLPDRRGDQEGLGSRRCAIMASRHSGSGCANAVPWLGDRVELLGDHSDDLRLLSVVAQPAAALVSRGLLCIGDAAHAMSPVGGVGINLAVQDAVAAGRILTPALRNGPVPPRLPCAQSSAGRWLPTASPRPFSEVAHRFAVGPALPRMMTQGRDRRRLRLPLE